MVGHGAWLGAVGGEAGAERGVATLGRLATRHVAGRWDELTRCRVTAWTLRWTGDAKYYVNTHHYH